MSSSASSDRATDALVRILDLVVAATLALPALPLLLGLALWVRLASGRPVFHRELRLGRGGQPFQLVKLRTLEAGREQECSIAVRGDPRITPTGRWLRHGRLDELPQLGAVLAGHMSLVGPRPLKPAHAASLPRELRDALLTARPGITGPSAVAFLADDDVLGERSEAADPARIESLYLQKLLPEKARLDAAYLEARSLAGDLAWLGRTLVALFSPARRRASRARVEQLLAP